jgi:hypothetical protein
VCVCFAKQRVKSNLAHTLTHTTQFLYLLRCLYLHCYICLYAVFLPYIFNHISWYFTLANPGIRLRVGVKITNMSIRTPKSNQCILYIFQSSCWHLFSHLQTLQNFPKKLFFKRGILTDCSISWKTLHNRPKRLYTVT